MAAITPKDPQLPPDLVSLPKYAIIGGSGVTVSGNERYSFATPFGCVVNISFLDPDHRVLFVNRHLSTSMDQNGAGTYAPPHEVNFHALIYALKKLNVKAICAIGSVGTLRPAKVPVGAIVMPDDYMFVLPTPVTFWGKCDMGLFEPSGTQEGRIHFAPATGNDATWVGFRRWVQQTINPVLPQNKDKVVLAPGQAEDVWPCVETTDVGNEVGVAYVQTTGPRFETRSEIQSYKMLGDVVGMTCAAEWTLAQELMLPYALVCAVDNSANGLSTHPGGPVQEYLDHKGAIATVTTGIVAALVPALARGGAAGAW